MEKNAQKKNNIKAVIAISVLVLAVASLLTVYLLNRPSASKDAKHITVTAEHLDGSEKTIELDTDAEYLSGALLESGFISGKDDTFGLWITTVDGETADDAKQQWWGFTVNGEMSSYGADSQPVMDGDVIVFTLNEGW